MKYHQDPGNHRLKLTSLTDWVFWPSNKHTLPSFDPYPCSHSITSFLFLFRNWSYMVHTYVWPISGLICDLKTGVLCTLSGHLSFFPCFSDVKRQELHPPREGTTWTDLWNATSYPLVMTNSLLLKMVIEIVDLPINSMVIFHSYVNVYQRVI